MADLSEDLKRIGGVLESAVFSDNSGHPVEIQVWVTEEADDHNIRREIAQLLLERGQLQTNERVLVFRLGERPREAQLARPSAPSAGSVEARPRIGRVILAGTDEQTEARVSLRMGQREAEGFGKAPRTHYSLMVTAATTLRAVETLVQVAGAFTLKGVSLVEVHSELVVVVLTETTIGGGRSLVGASLVGDGEVYEATVKAALDSINRQLSQISVT